MDIDKDINHEVTVILLKKIIELLDKEDEPEESIKADEIRAALRNELAGVIKAVKSIPETDNSGILKELRSLKDAVNAIEVKPTVNVAGAEVTIPEIKLPDINIPEFNIPTPQVNYTPPEIRIQAPIVNVPAPIVNTPNIDIESIIRSLEVNLNKLRTNGETRPLAVRMTDGQKWIKELKHLNHQTTQFMSDVSYIRDTHGIRINPAREESVFLPSSIGNGSTRVTTAGVRTKISQVSYPTKYVIITANASNVGRIWVGGYTISANNGRPLESSESERFEIDDVSKIYIDADVDGEGVSYTFASSLSTVPAYLLGEDGFPILNETGEYVLTEY